MYMCILWYMYMCMFMKILSIDSPQFHAMDTLHQSNYDINSATSRLVPRGPVLCADELEAWSQGMWYIQFVYNVHVHVHVHIYMYMYIRCSYVYNVCTCIVIIIHVCLAC